MAGFPRTQRLVVALLAALLAAAFGATACSAAASEAFDRSFNRVGYSIQPLGGWAAAVASAIQPDRKIVTAGEADIDGTAELVSSRVNADGTMDTSYGNDGWVTVNINGSAGANAIAVQPNGDIVLAGYGIGGDRDVFAAARLTPSGALDPTFGTNGIATVPIGSAAIANAVAIQPDGRIDLGGTADVSHNEVAVARLNADGTLDTGFGTHGVTTFSPAAAGWGMVLQPDGDLVVAGQETYGGTQAYMAARVTATGAIDSTFGDDGVVTVPIGSFAFGDAIALQSDGNIVLAGTAYTDTQVAATVRLTPSGSLDPSYGTGGIATLDDWHEVNGASIDSSGRIVLAATGASVVRLNPDGTPDSGFGNAGQVVEQIGSSSDAANGVTIDPFSGDIILSGCVKISGRLDLSVLRLTTRVPTTPLRTTPPASRAKTTVGKGVAQKTKKGKKTSARGRSRHNRKKAGLDSAA